MKRNYERETDEGRLERTEDRESRNIQFKDLDAKASISILFRPVTDSLYMAGDRAFLKWVGLR